MAEEKTKETPKAEKNDDGGSNKIEDKLKKVFKPSKKIDPLKSAKEALKTVNITQTIDVEQIVDKVLKRTDFEMSRQFSWPDAIKFFEKDDTGKTMKINDLVDELVSDTNAMSVTSRKNRYNEYVSAINKLPVLNKLLRVTTANVISPDNITKETYHILPTDTILEDDESVTNMCGKFKMILEKLKLHDKINDIVFQTLLYGDYFVEIQSSKKMLMQTLYNLQIPIISENVNLKTMMNKMSDGINIKVNYTLNNKHKLIIEESQNIMTQINESSSIVKEMMNEIFQLNGSVLSEDTLYEDLYSDNIKENLFKILTEDVLKIKIKDEEEKEKEDELKNKQQSPMDLRHVIDVLPVDASLSNISLKFIKPEEVVVLKYNDICYGYLHVRGVQDATSNMTGSTSLAGMSSSSSTAVIDNEKNLNMQVLNNFLQKMSDYFKEKFGEVNPDGTNGVNIEQMAPGLQQVIGEILSSHATETIVRYIPPSNMQQFTRRGVGCYDPYGESLLDSLMFMARMAIADQISSTINKIAKTGKRFKYGVKANTYAQAMNSIQNLKKSLAKQIVTVDSFGSIDAIPAIISSQKNYYIPEVGGEAAMTIDTLDMGTAKDYGEPGDDLTKNILTGADIPPVVLGRPDYSGNKSTAIAETESFARSIIDIQAMFSNQFTELLGKIYIALYMKSKDFNMAYRYVRFTFPAPRSMMLNNINQDLSNLSQVIDTMEKFGVPKEEIIKQYYPEIQSLNIKVDKALEQLSKNKGNNNSGVDADGFASFDAGGGDMGFGGDLGGGTAPDMGGGMMGSGPEAGGGEPTGGGGELDLSALGL